MARLGDICTVVSGSTPKTGVAEYWDGTVKWITPAELNEDSFYITDSVRHITEDGKEKVIAIDGHGSYVTEIVDD